MMIFFSLDALPEDCDCNLNGSWPLIVGDEAQLIKGGEKTVAGSGMRIHGRLNKEKTLIKLKEFN